MAGIYIPGMQMPMNCCRCPCADLEYYDCNLMPGTGISSDRKSGKRLDNCPLVPVPPHGRLIDADALSKRIKDEGRHQAECYADRYSPVVLAYADCCWKVESAPTIIPASEEGE